MMTLYLQGMGNSKKETARSIPMEDVGHDNFPQCDVTVETRKTEIFFCHSELREKTDFKSSQRRKAKDSPVTPQEQTELRGLLDAWKCEQTGPQHSAATGLQRSRIEQATVQDMTKVNRTTSTTSQERKWDRSYGSSVFFRRKQLTLMGWDDAALQNRIDGGKYEGSSFTFFREGRSCRRGTLDVCDQLEDWPNKQSMSSTR